MDNEVKIQIETKLKGSTATSLEKYAAALDKVNKAAKGIDIEAINAADVLNKKKNGKSVGKESKDLAKNLKSAFKSATIFAVAKGMQKAAESITRLTQKSIDYTESLNLFAVAFAEEGKDIKETTNAALKFTNSLKEMYGLSDNWIINTTGKFKQMANAMGFANETGTEMAELLTRMSLDISSLYNVDFDRATQTLQSALSGQTKPIRSVAGADITQQTLQSTLANLGIDKNVQQLNYAEKRLLIIISLTQQLSKATGDLGRTIEQPANQLRMLSSQWENLTKAVGNMFLPILKKVLPYLNAILMVLTEIIKTIAVIFGYNEDDALDGAKDLEFYTGKTADNLGTSASNAKKLKQGLRGFDKLNTISSSSSSGAGTGGMSGGVSNDLLKAFQDAQKQYNDLLTTTETKASKIRDKIMSWLGFTKQVDEETGEVSFKFDHITGGTVLGALVVGGSIFKGVSGIFKIFKSIGLLKFPLIEKLFKGIIGGKGASDAVNAGGEIAGAANNNASKLKIPAITDVLKGLADVAIIIVGTVAIFEAIGWIMKIPKFKETLTIGVDAVVETFLGIGKIIIPLGLMTAAMLGLGLLGGSGVASIAMGLADVAIVITGTTAIFTAIGGLMSISGWKEALTVGIDSVIKVFEGIEKICVPLGLMTVALLAVGLTGGAGAMAILAGLGDLALVVGGLEIVLVALGKLSDNKFVKTGIDSAFEVLNKIAEGIGSFAGILVESFLDVATSSLGSVGTHLSEFMENAQPFFDNINKVDEAATRGVKNLADALLALTKQSIIEGLTSWFTGGVSLTNFGKDLESFGPSFKKYADSVKGIDGKSVEASANSAKALSEFVDNLPRTGGAWQSFVGEKNLGKFAEDLASFGPSFKTYYNNVKNIDQSIIEKSVSGAKSIASFVDNINVSGGLWQKVTGSKDLSKFASDLAGFGPSFKSYYDNVKNIDSDVVEKSASSATAIATFVNSLESTNIFSGIFSGKKDLSDFGGELEKFGKKYKSYYDTIKDINFTKVDNLNSAITHINNEMKTVKNNGLDTTLKNYSTELGNAAKNIKTFYDTALSQTNGQTAGKNFGKGIVNGIKSALNSGNLKITLKNSDNLSVGDRFSFTATANYAKGGLPPVGQLFVANEKGPELVGQIGGQSFVANQNQMLDLIDKKISNSSGGVKNATFIIQVGSKDVAKQVLNDLEGMAKTDGKPIVIGG